MLNRDDIEILDNVNEDILGYGTPSNTTQRLVDQGYVEIVRTGSHWFGRLTRKGQRAVQG